MGSRTTTISSLSAAQTISSAWILVLLCDGYPSKSHDLPEKVLLKKGLRRPSRLDRKNFFPGLDLKQRINYCHFRQRKLADNKDLEFPNRLCKAIAGSHSFAYNQEAFVGAQLAIATSGNGVLDYELTKHDGIQGVWVGAAEHGDGDDGDLDNLALWPGGESARKKRRPTGMWR